MTAEELKDYFIKKLIETKSKYSSKRFIAIYTAILLGLVTLKIIWKAEVTELMIYAGTLMGFITSLIVTTVIGDNRNKRIEKENGNPNGHKDSID